VVIRRTEAGRAAASRGRSRSRSGSGGRVGARAADRDGGGERDMASGEKPPTARQEQKRLRNERQGLHTLVHFSAQVEPFLTRNTP